MAGLRTQTLAHKGEKLLCAVFDESLESVEEEKAATNGGQKWTE